METKKHMVIIECNDGIHTNAQFFEDGKLISGGSAKKHPQDPYNFFEGVEFAMTRVQENIPKFDLAKDLRAGMFVKVCESWYLFAEEYLVTKRGTLIRYIPEITNPLIERVVRTKSFKDCYHANYTPSDILYDVAEKMPF